MRSLGLDLEPAAKTLIAISVLAVVVMASVSWRRCQETMLDLRDSALGMVFVVIGVILMIVTMVAFIWRVVLVMKYTPAAACTDEQVPTCTVIVPAYNEGRGVVDTIRSILASDFPAGKLQVIAVDDGSVDDTWVWLRRASREFQGRLEVYKLVRNCGKRRALYEAFKLSKGEVLVTVDSDTILEKQALRNLVSPFYHDSSVGAVAGNIRVLNVNEGLIPRMMEVSFAFSFDFVRGSQSRVNAVFCTPGALSAYRREPLMKVLGEWVKQTFGGRPSNIGEDRAMTNLLLREGHHVHFQSNAVAFTKCRPASSRSARC